MKIFHTVIIVPLMLSIFCTEVPNTTKSKEIDQTSNLDNLSTRDKDVLNSSNLFGFNIFKKIIEKEDESKNVFISPLSISIALTMTENGAAGATRDSMMMVLEQSGYSIEEINQSCKDLEQILENADDEVAFDIANSIWPRISKAIVPEFTDICKDYYGAHVQAMNWSIPESADTVNKWIEDNTNGLIKDAVEKPILNDPAMKLINAIYFKGFWSVVFDSNSTYKNNFTKSDGSIVACDFMHKNAEDDSTLLYYEDEICQVASLPYGNGNFFMTVLLPKDGNEISDLLEMIDKNKWDAILEDMVKEDFSIQMPKYKFGYKSALREHLIDLGMGIAFSESTADFANMFEDSSGYIDKVIHTTFIQTDESGTEAAAVTIVDIVDSALPDIKSINLNKPYLFVIHEKISKSIIFMGRLSEPVWKD